MSDFTMTIELTPNIHVKTSSQYVPHQFSPEDDHYFFAYTVEIFNDSPKTVKLFSRHWVITDGNCDSKEVSGMGVVGEQPIIKPDQTFRYTSCALLKTPVGTMQGNYTFLTDEGNQFTVPIKPLRLADLALLN